MSNAPQNSLAGKERGRTSAPNRNSRKPPPAHIGLRIQGDVSRSLCQDPQEEGPTHPLKTQSLIGTVSFKHCTRGELENSAKECPA